MTYKSIEKQAIALRLLLKGKAGISQYGFYNVHFSLVAGRQLK